MDATTLLVHTGQKEEGVITSSMKIILQWVGFTKWFALLLNAALNVHVDKTSSKVKASIAQQLHEFAIILLRFKLH